MTLFHGNRAQGCEDIASALFTVERVYTMNGRVARLLAVLFTMVAAVFPQPPGGTCAVTWSWMRRM